MEYRVFPMDESTWRIEEYDAANSAYIYLLTGSEKALLLDTGFGTIDLPAIVRGLTPLPVEVVNTHAHFDHIGADAMFDTVYMHRADKDLYEQDGGKQYLPDVPPRPLAKNVHWIEDGVMFELGGRSLEVISTPGHSLGCICLLDAARRWLFTGDTCCKADVLLCLGYCTGVREYLDTIRRLQALRPKFDLTWPCHHAVPVKPEILDEFEQAAVLLSEGKAQGEDFRTPFGNFKRFPYKDIAIVYIDGNL